MIAIALLVPAIAFADSGLGYPGAPDYSQPIPDRSVRFELGAAYDVGNFSLARIDDLAMGLHGEVGLRYDRLAIAAAIGWLWASDGTGWTPPPTVGHPIETPPVWTSLRRDMLFARYSFVEERTTTNAKHSHKVLSFVRGDTWLELGVGREDITEHPGDELSRRVVSIGLGIQTISRDGDSHLSAYLALRILRATNPDGGTDHALVVSMSVLGGN